jgi:hypothetical protein
MEKCTVVLMMGDERVTDINALTDGVALTLKGRDVQIFIKAFGRTYAMYVNTADTVLSMKEQFDKIIPPLSIDDGRPKRFMFKGRQLEDTQRIGYYGLEKESTIVYVPRELGGAGIVSWKPEPKLDPKTKPLATSTPPTEEPGLF